MQVNNELPEIKKISNIEKDFLKIDELKEYLGVGSDKIYKMCENGLPRYRPYGNTVYYYKPDVIDYILEYEV